MVRTRVEEHSIEGSDEWVNTEPFVFNARNEGFCRLPAWEATTGARDYLCLILTEDPWNLLTFVRDMVHLQCEPTPRHSVVVRRWCLDLKSTRTLQRKGKNISYLLPSGPRVSLIATVYRSTTGSVFLGSIGLRIHL